MARGRLRAIDAMIEKLTMESAGKPFEELSDLLQPEGRAVMGALTMTGESQRMLRLITVYTPTAPKWTDPRTRGGRS